MARTNRRERHAYVLGRRIAAGLLGLVLISPPPASATDLNLLATSSANVTGGKVGGQSTSTRDFNQSLDMNYNWNASPLFSYRLRFRGSDDESSNSSAGTRTTSTSRFVEPGGDLTLTGSRYSLNAGGRLRETLTSGSQTSSLRLTEDNEFFRAFYTPDLLPAFTFQVDRTADSDDQNPKGVNRQDIRTLFGANYTMAEKVNLAYTFTQQTNDDSVSGRKQEQRTHVGTLSYVDNFFTDRLTVNGNYLINRLDTIERVTSTTVGGAVVVPVQLTNAFSLLEKDPTVAGVNKIPPDPTAYQTLPGGASTRFQISALLVADPSTSLNQSVAVRPVPGATITRLRLSVTGGGSFDVSPLSIQVQNLDLRVYASNSTLGIIDQTAWSPVASSIESRPTDLNPFFEITIPATNATFLKIHVAADPAQPVSPALTATFVEAFSQATAGGSSKISTGNLLQSVAGGLTARPFEALTLNGNMTFSTNKQDPSGRQDDTGTYSFIATGTPHRLLTATGVYQATFTTSNDAQTPRTDARIASLTLSSTPLPTLTTSLSGSRSENETGGVLQNRSDSLGFNTALKPYRNLNVDFTASGTQASDFVADTRTRGFSAALNANAVLTPRLTGLSGYAFSLNNVTGGSAPSSTTTNTGFLSLTYTLSRFLNASGRWDLSNSGGNTAITQQYRLDLIPTLKTSVFLTYLRTDQLGGATSVNTNSLSLTARWNISRHLDLNATGSFTRGATGDTVYSLFTTLAFRL